ncbi:MAG: hypothetical protein HY686_07455 [Chloroflexi bacterium]|nr:hypothetical protein [Chloroflexota bacterium]
MAQDEQQLKGLPSSNQVLKTSRDPASLATLGNAAVRYVMRNPYQYDQKWIERLAKAVGALKDTIESGKPPNSAIAELMLVLSRPQDRPMSRTEIEIAGINEPSADEVEAWVWGGDMAETTRLFMAAAVSAALSWLAFAVVTYGLESPGTLATLIFISLGSVALAAASGILGKGLYRQYVARPYLSWKDRSGYPEATIERNAEHFRKTLRFWYVYTGGGVFLAASVGLAIVLGKNLLSDIVSDYAPVRLAMLSSVALGLVLSALGAWPIVRRVIAMAEAQSRLGRAKYLSSPRILLTLLPLLTGAVSVLINWLFR